MGSASVNRALLLVAFLVSGASALVYQVVWTREVELVVGCSTLAASAVLVAFMGGLALGARLLGPLADRVAKPLALYGALEVGVALVALAVPLLVERIGPLYGEAARAGLPLGPLRFGVAVLILLAPSVLMGASFPAIVAEATRAGGDVKASVGVLYAANLAGAIAGALLAAFVLTAALGLRATNRLAAIADLAVGAVAIALAAPRGEARADARPTGDGSPGDEALAPLLAPLLFLSGFVVLGLEVVWTRLLVFSLGSTVYGFAIVVSSTLLGLALGAALVPRVLRDAAPRLALAHAGIALASVTGLAVAPWLFDLMLALTRVTGRTGGAFVAGAYAAAFALILAPATIAGVVFPALAALAAARAPRRGEAPGRAQAVNGLGAVLGAGLAGVVLVPRLGLAGTVGLLALLEAGAALLLAREGPRHGTLVRIACALAVAVFVAGRFAPADALDGVLRAERGGRPPHLLAWREGPAATASVVEDDRGRALRLDGFEAAAIGGSYRYMRLMALAPLLLHPEPRDALVICFGTGTTAGTLALDPGLRRLEIVEIEPSVLELAPFFAERNHRVLESPIVRTHLDDGRAFLYAAAPGSLDLVTLEPLPPTHAGVVALYSREFYELAARALRPDGVACQWVPTQFLRDADTRTIVATFAAVFPDSVLLLLDTTGILVGTRDATRPLLDRTAVEKRLATPALRAELASCGLAGADGLASICVLDREGVARFASGARLTTDDEPRIEYAPVRHRVVDLVGDLTPWQAESLLALADEGVKPAPALGAIDSTRRLVVAADAARVEVALGAPGRAAARFLALAERLDDPRAKASALLGAAQMLQKAGKRDLAARLVERAAAVDPAHPALGAARAAVR